jgi:hypothetical protein
MSLDFDSSCHCQDPRWLFEVFVGDTIVDSATVNILDPDVEEQAHAHQQRQLAITTTADAAGQDWKLRLSCPACGAGDIVTNAQKVLHVLSPHDGRIGYPEIESDCGHICMASPPTISLLADVERSHVVVCFPCFEKDSERWNQAKGNDE